MPDPPEAPQSERATPPVPTTTAETVALGPTKDSSGNPVLGCIGSVLTMIFRLVLLTGGAGIALVVGVGIATVQPADVTNEQPLLETVMQQVDRFRE